MSVAKAAGAAAVVVGVAGTGYGVSEYLRRPYTLANFLSSTSDQSKKREYENKLGGIEANKHVFVADMPENENWWKKRFDDLSQKSVEKSTEFSNVVTYSSSDQKAINKLCDAAYKKHVSLFSDDSSSDDKNKYKKNVEAYCTLSGEAGSVVLGAEGVPTTLKGEDDYSGANNNKYGFKHADKLISVEADRNKPFWEKRVEELSNESGLTIAEDGFFKTDFKSKLEAYKSAKTEVNKLNEAVKALKDDCKAKYSDETNSEENDKSKWAEVWKFCSVDRKIPDNLKTQ
ncbi:hypothetical protein [Candidatus Mycoplasma haematohominis]|uniref:hypothetical protein n=1 Tax=Candidatus Mycoplasma haematohominis TaxID=1494318 RepID=UPI001C0A754F|nr:hypothetical protein [Candidatus Mycoplasma haemohominis]